MRQMCWMASPGSTDKTKTLHLRIDSNDPWKSYTAFPQLKVPDHNVPGGSKGWATYQKLLKAGWVLIDSPRSLASIASIGALDVPQ